MENKILPSGVGIQYKKGLYGYRIEYFFNNKRIAESEALARIEKLNNGK